MPEKTIEADGIALCAEDFGDPAHPPILLIAGLGSSMLWWEEGFCRMLAEGGRYVIRYDHRDTGRSTTYEHGRPGYTGADLAEDAVRVLDGLGIAAAHLVGVSAGGGIAQEVALGHPARVRSLTLISTSPATGGDRELPPPAAELSRFASTAEVDWSRPDSVLEHLVGYARVLAGGERTFDEARLRALARREAERARDLAALQNHDVMAHGEGSPKPLSAIAAPTLVVHGTADPLFPAGHGEALAREIPGAVLMLLHGAGHGFDPGDWEPIAGAVLEHTDAPAGAARTR